MPRDIRLEKSTKKHKADLVANLLEPEVYKLLWTKQKLVKISPLLNKRVCAKALHALLKCYGKENRRHIRLINTFFNLSKKEIESEFCYFSNILVRELEQVVGREIYKPFIKDILVIQSLQKIVSFQITSLNSLSTVARNSNLAHFSKLLEAIKDEEKEFNAVFSEIALQDLYTRLDN